MTNNYACSKIEKTISPVYKILWSGWDLSAKP